MAVKIVSDPQPPRERVQHRVGGEIRTKQAEADQADANSIIAKWIKTGSVVTPGVHYEYGDFHNSVDYHSALNSVVKAQEAFDHLPANVKRHVQQDPGQFLDMVYSPERRAELEELGLVPEHAPEDAAPAAKEPPASAPTEDGETK